MEHVHQPGPCWTWRCFELVLLSRQQHEVLSRPPPTVEQQESCRSSQSGTSLVVWQEIDPDADCISRKIWHCLRPLGWNWEKFYIWQIWHLTWGKKCGDYSMGIWPFSFWFHLQMLSEDAEEWRLCRPKNILISSSLCNRKCDPGYCDNGLRLVMVLTAWWYWRWQSYVLG